MRSSDTLSGAVRHGARVRAASFLALTSQTNSEVFQSSSLSSRRPAASPLSNDGWGFILSTARFRIRVEVPALRCSVICTPQPIDDLHSYMGREGHAMRALVISGLMGALLFWNVGTSLGAPAQRSCWFGTIQWFLTCPTDRPTTAVSTLGEGNNGAEISGSADPADPSGSNDQHSGSKGGSGSGNNGSSGSGSSGGGTTGGGTTGGGSTGGGSTGGSGHGHGEGGASGHSDNNGNGQGNHEHK